MANVRMRVEVMVRATSLPVVGDSSRVGNGVWDVEVPEECVPQVMAKVEDRLDVLAECRRDAREAGRFDGDLFRERMGRSFRPLASARVL